MSEYLGMEVAKPNKPIARGDLYIFPITSADQVVIDENTDKRLGTVLARTPYFVDDASVE